MDKIKVRFIRPVGMYGADEIGYLRQEQIDVLGDMIEVMKEKEAKNASNKSMASKKKATK